VNRVIELCGFLMTSGTIDPISLSNRLGLTGAVADASGINKLREEATTLRKQLTASQNQIQGNRTSYEYSINQLRREKDYLASTIKTQTEELEENESELANIEDQLQEIVDIIEEYTDDAYDPTDESRIEFIQGALEKLLEDLEALKAEREE
jgi:DNA repair exonuclease SbcCD ATPase subunit